MKANGGQPGAGPGPEPAPSDIEAEAAEWVIRLDDPRTSPQDLKAFQVWRSQGPLQREAFEFASRTWDSLAALPLSAASAAQAGRSGPGRAVLAMAMVAAMVMAGGFLWLGNPLIHLTADHVAGQSLRVIDLPDGSRVELAPGSAITIDYSDSLRGVELLQGEAYFIATPAETQGNRPFRVQAENVSVTAIGTRFSVGILADRVDVVVTEHSVRVASGPVTHATVAEGQAIGYEPGSGLSGPRSVNTDFHTAWRQGQLIFDNRPLSEVVEELNRYRRGRIVIRDDALAQRRVSGIFQTSDIGSALDSITTGIDLRRMSLPPFVTVLY